MNDNKILIVDDENLISWSVASTLKKDGYRVETAASGREAVATFEEFRPELVIMDICLPDESGLDLLKKFKSANPELHVIMMTAYANADSAVQALKDGAAEYFGKPFHLGAVREAVQRAFEKRLINKDEDRFRGELRKKSVHDRLIGNSPRMIEVFKMIRVCADADAKTVLITGESGTGKELVAKAIHYHSARAQAPFIEINCASIPENLLENELFGHERGAYTDASRRQKGVFEMAEGGTLFLDEIGDMPFAMQAKILKAIETKRFRRLGGQEDVEANVRIVAATHQNLPRMVKEGKFRGDLFFRLNVMHIPLPPLRERADDIEPLVNHFIESLNQEYGRSVQGMASEAIGYLTAYRWPGNVRELRNCIERLMMLEQEKLLSAQHLSDEIKQGGSLDQEEACEVVTSEFAGEEIRLPPSGFSLEELEKLLIQLALRKAGGNIAKASIFLKTSRDTLRYRIKKHGLGECLGGERFRGFAAFPAQAEDLLRNWG